jgi:transcriptional/translational regulatory protein YebC/TACO1
MFDRTGQVDYPAKAASEDEMMEAAIEAGAQDVESDMGDGRYEEGAGHSVYTAFEDLNEVAAALEAKFGPAASTKIVWRPKSLVPVTGDQATTMMKLLDALDEDDDVQSVYSNADISDEDAAAYGG